MNLPEPQSEHHWLQRLVGDWTFESTCPGPSGEPQTHRGRERVRALGGFWIVSEGNGEMPGGGTAETLMVLGYDPARRKYVGSWNGSMMSHMWIYTGTLDASGTTLTLDTTGPSMTGDDKTVQYQDIIEFQGGSERILRSKALGEDGIWKEFVRVVYRRTHSE